MCLADYAIGQSLFGSERQLAVAATSGILVEANKNRALLIFGPPKTNNVWISTNNPAVVGQGFILTVGAQPFVLDWQRHGNQASRAWYAITVAGADNISVLEGEFELKRAREFLTLLERGGY